MSQTAITYAFEQWKAQQAANGVDVVLDEFVFANVPGLDVSAPVGRAEALPDAAMIVHRQAVTKTGMVNEKGVVYSVVLGAGTGDFEFNWIGLINRASGTLAMIVHAPTQQKIKTAAGQQGNVLTRSFLMEYNGAANETAISTPADTWQIDFTARLDGVDERIRIENIDVYGPAAFFGDGFLVTRSGAQYHVTGGVGYVAGLRTELPQALDITVTTKPVNVWLDVAWRGSLTSVWGVESKITVAASLADYVQNGVTHHVFAVARIEADGSITDLRPKGSLNEQQGEQKYLRKDKDLSDVSDVTAARKNLGLGSAATRDTGTGQGNVLLQGAWGLGGAERKSAAGDEHVSRFFYENYLPAALYPESVVVVQSGGPTPGEWGQLAVSYGEAFRVFAAHKSFSGQPEVTELFHDRRKPTNADVGSYPDTGGTLNGNMAATGTVTSGPGKDMSAGQDLWAGRDLYANRHLQVTGAATLGSLTVNGDTATTGNIDAGGYVRSAAGKDVVSQNDIWAARDIYAQRNIIVTYDVSVGRDLKVAGNAAVTGNIDAGGYVRSGAGKDIVSQNDIWATRNVSVGRDLTVEGSAGVAGNFDAGGYVRSGAGEDIVSQNDIWATRNVSVGRDLTVQGNAGVTGNAEVAGNIRAKDIAAQNDVWAARDIHAQRNINISAAATVGLDLTVGGNAGVTGNIDAGGYVRSGVGKDIVSQNDIWASRYIYESGLRVYSPNNPPPAKFSRALNTISWEKNLETGVIRQWGFIDVGDNAYITVTLPLAFPSSFLALHITPRVPGAITGVNVASAGGQIFSNNSFGVGMSINFEPQWTGVYFEAIGV
ncbi:phage tail protein [Enterobacter cloacae]|uniref:phage tail-collar fiber domain-containing protein n=1 Tax=Enterobacter cloacae TaxID=550 RepID=UPI002B1D4ADD|nr:phage tail protein [Enterobacter cloacae]MEA3725901.1 phage tail protein [Enterobacter cloacae]MEA3730820.1 phage tail protein [Enterobacter cloacae]MEA3740140.1 phage tail protein [Enterobacter cloacae]MEA3754031.1 phage tail protein [Enterobacter cloacae]MEA3768107.1 phage tail protein [Enterobacter cloacae]